MYVLLLLWSKKGRKIGTHVSCKFHTSNEKEIKEYSAIHFFMILNLATGIKCKTIICRVWKAQCSARPRCG